MMSVTTGIGSYQPFPNKRPARFNFGLLPERGLMCGQQSVGLRPVALGAFYRSRSAEALYKPPSQRVASPDRPRSAQGSRQKDLRRLVSATRRCKVCRKALATGGFFMHEDGFYCAEDYQELFGIRCHNCGEFVEGDVVTALGQTYHQQCFVCAQCGKPFPQGEQVTQQGEDCLCEACIESTNQEESRICAGCQGEIKSGQALLAIDKQWHLWCFKCHHCQGLLAGEFMGRDGQPYCERDYHVLFGVKCATCGEYITGKVLQAGDNHFHPECSCCAICGQKFGPGEDMYTLNGSVWHPQCSENARQSQQEKSNGEDEVIREENNISRTLPGMTLNTSQQALEEQVQTRTHSEGGDSAISLNTPSSPERTEHFRHASQGRMANGRPASSSSTTSVSSASSPEFGGTSDRDEVYSPTRTAPVSCHTSEMNGSQESEQEKRSSFDWRSRYSVDEGLGDITGMKRSPLRRSLSGENSLASGVSTSSRTHAHWSVHHKTSNPANEFEQKSAGGSSWRRASLGSESRRRHSSKDNRQSQPITEVYPLDVLQGQGNYRLPKDVDRTRLEDYLSEEDFKKAFDMTRAEYKKLQVWRQRDLKKRAKLF